MLLISRTGSSVCPRLRRCPAHARGEHLPTPLAARNNVGEATIGADLAEPHTALFTPKAASGLGLFALNGVDGPTSR
jgi:hypothetical protein